ncbi:EF-P lysine aminoacylase EpmA [Legionella sp. W05-934-2]|uniref:EF-P lysine aminoacylase EpmA n=1 Tax=Legionella sp. W05-934-2 TaxID=1198649 RepID=UPI0034619F6D
MKDVTSWKPTATIADLNSRSRFIQSIRQFFINQGYLEVDTPCLGEYGVTDCYLKNIEAVCNSETHYLQTSPEYYMKRLLAAGSGPIFQIGKVFRDEEKGRWHQPEFTMLEFYQLDIDHLQLITVISELFQTICGWPPIKLVTYQSLFEQNCGINPHLATLEELQICLKEFGLETVLPATEQDRDQYLFLLMADIIEPSLTEHDRPLAVIDFPQSQAALAQIQDGKAQRFEIYYRGLELANGFHELTDITEQTKRFEQDNQSRRQQQKEPSVIDPHFLAALNYGLPACSGVAIGIDRLVALYLGHQQIKTVISFAKE